MSFVAQWLQSNADQLKSLIPATPTEPGQGATDNERERFAHAVRMRNILVEPQLALLAAAQLALDYAQQRARERAPRR